MYECAGVEPVFLSKEQAIDYAKCRACFRSGEIHILRSSSTVERIKKVISRLFELAVIEPIEPNATHT